MGGYPFTVEDLKDRGEYDYALKVVDRWENDYPTEKLDGLSFFWRGKLLFILHPGEQAVRYLQLAEAVHPKGNHVPEAVWLQANCYMAMGKYDQALQQFQRIQGEFTTSDYAQRAPAKVKECQGHLPPPAPETRPAPARGMNGIVPNLPSQNGDSPGPTPGKRP
jgi:tetratricopeptide (TPR) repeat protein